MRSDFHCEESSLSSWSEVYTGVISFFQMLRMHVLVSVLWNPRLVAVYNNKKICLHVTDKQHDYHSWLHDWARDLNLPSVCLTEDAQHGGQAA